VRPLNCSKNFVNCAGIIDHLLNNCNYIQYCSSLQKHSLYINNLDPIRNYAEASNVAGNFYQYSTTT
jgi:hypothetical protein